MKQITLLLMMAIYFVGFSQQEVVQDFESSPSTAGFEGLESAAIVSDPSAAGNGNVLELITSTTGNPWQGAEVTLADDSVLDLTSDITISIDVWSNTAFSPMIKVESSEGADAAANTQSHSGSGWETLTFTFDTGSDGTATANGTYTKVVFFPNRNSADSGWNDPIIDATFYFDNITGVKTTIAGGSTGNPPAVAAPMPPARPDNEVISIYSDAYAQQPLNFDAGFCGFDSTEEIQVDGNNTMLYKGNACQGIIFDSPVDASTFTNLHFDFYVEPGTDLLGSVISLKFNQTNGEGPDDDIFLDNVFTETSNPAIVTGEWVEVDIAVDLSNFDALDEFVITAGTLSNKMYYDNLYLYGGTLSTDSFESIQFSAYPNPTLDNWNIKSSNTNIQNVEIFNTLGRLVKEVTANNTEVVIDASDLSSGIYFAKIYNDSNQNNTIKLIKR